ncbi:MAG: helix-turn-helix domain-containing protein [Planctomycetota bacterium]|jgi:DNA-binding Xre family transcriptional regulator
MTYAKLSALTGISQQTLHSIASRPGYHCSVTRIETLCRTLDVHLHDMMEMIDDPPKPKRRP